jgi:hypothetical protein
VRGEFHVGRVPLVFVLEADPPPAAARFAVRNPAYVRCAGPGVRVLCGGNFT